VIERALSVRAPWWWAILYAGKDIENRDWATRYRGRVLVHASKWWKTEEVKADHEDAVDIHRKLTGEAVPESVHDKQAWTWRRMRDTGGHIVGSVEIVDCVIQSASPWFFGEFGFVLRDPIAFAKPVPCKGALGFFRPADGVLEACAHG
jgi:hypothetical protein